MLKNLQVRKFEKIFTSHISGKGFISRMYKKFSNKITHKPIKYGQKNLNGVTEEWRFFISMANKHFKRDSGSLVSSEMQNKAKTTISTYPSE